MENASGKQVIQDVFYDKVKKFYYNNQYKKAFKEAT
jgi:hypothetical protein